MTEKIQVHLCGTGWGIGAYRLIENGIETMGYGFYRPENPHDFFPDTSCNTEIELAAHKAACEEWDKNHET